MKTTNANRAARLSALSCILFMAASAKPEAAPGLINSIEASADMSNAKAHLENTFKGLRVKVGNAQRGSLDCSGLTIGGKDAAVRELTLLGNKYKAVKEHFHTSRGTPGGPVAAVAGSRPEPSNDFGGRHAWSGRLEDSDGLAAGTMTVVWDDSCSAHTFLLDIQLPTVDDGAGGVHARSISSVPCVDGGDSCMWLADVTHAPLPRAHFKDVPSEGRRLSAEELDEVAAHDADVELLQQLLEGDGDAHDTFHRMGGRRLEGEDAVIMPSGRRLDTGSVVKVLFAYTPAATASAGGTTAITNKIYAAINLANQVLVNSGLGFTFDGWLVPVSYTEPSTIGSALDALTNGNVPNIRSYREQYHFDLIQLISNVGLKEGICGIGWQMASASTSYAFHGYSVTQHSCIGSSSLSHVHEIGHNMGAQHDRATQSPSTVWSFGWGYNYCGSTSATRVVTIMSYYPPSCPGSYRVPYFSTPSRSVNGIPLGNSVTRNRDVLTATKYSVANFRAGA